MNYKEEIQKLLNSLKELGFDRRHIEKELDYRAEYLDQILAKGGNKKIVSRLERYYLEKSKDESILKKISEAGKEIGELKAKCLELEAKFNVLIPAFANLSAGFQEKEFSQVYNGLIRAIDVEFGGLKESVREREGDQE